jgi:hypothetical protein
MSDLQRYDVFQRPFPHRSRTGDWVKAEEAEARIKELEAERDEYKLAADVEAGLFNDAQARLRAADELADAVAEVAIGGRGSVKTFLLDALTAYRNGGQDDRE